MCRGGKIAKITNAENFDLVIGSRGRGSAKEMFLGSTSNHAGSPVSIFGLNVTPFFANTPISESRISPCCMAIIS